MISITLGYPRRFARELGLVGVLAVLLGAGAARHMACEQTFYFWDWAVHHDLARRLLVAFQGGWGEAWSFLKTSFNADYNALFAVPLAPFMAVWGSERTVFVLLLVVVYGVALCRCGAAWLNISQRRSGFGWIAVGSLLPLLSPLVWGVPLIGYSDQAGFLVILLGLVAAGSDPGWEKWRTIPALAATAALATLMRRQYSYDALLLLGVAGAVQMAVRTQAAWPEWRRAFIRELAWAVGRAALTGVGALGLLLLVSPEFVRLAAHVGQTNLYGSWWISITDKIVFYETQLGLLAIFLAVLGLLAGFRHHRRAAAWWLAALYALVVAAWWLLAVPQAGVHFTLHFQYFLLLGWAGLLDGLARISDRWLRLSLTGLTVVLLFWISMGGLPDVWGWRIPVLSPLGPAPQAAQRMPDYDELWRVGKFIERRAGARRPVLLAGVSQRLNTSILAAAVQEASNGDCRAILFHSPTVDSRDELALTPYSQAGLILTPIPRQGTGETTMLEFYHSLVFPSPAEPACFRLRAERFSLTDSVSLRCYERIAPSDSERLLNWGAAMAAPILKRYPHKSPWMAVEAVWYLYTWTGPDGLHAQGYAPSEPASGPTRLAYFQNVPGGALLSAQVLEGTGQLSARIGRLDRKLAGGVQWLGRWPIPPAGQPLRIGLEGGASNGLVLDFTGPGGGPIHLQNLRVESPGANP